MGLLGRRYSASKEKFWRDLIFPKKSVAYIRLLLGLVAIGGSSPPTSPRLSITGVQHRLSLSI
jgi:hypothetical protein